MEILCNIATNKFVLVKMSIFGALVEYWQQMDLLGSTFQYANMVILLSK